MANEIPNPNGEPVNSATPTGTHESNANRLVNANTTDVDSVGVFTTAQSLVTFPGAAMAVTTVWNVLGRYDASWGKANLKIPIILSLVIGLFIWILSVSKGSSWKDKLSGLGIALINSATIAAAALGINPNAP